MAMISLSIKPFNVYKLVYLEKFRVSGFNYEMCFMLLVAVPMFLVIVSTSSYLIIIMKEDSRSPWVKNNFELNRNYRGFL